MPDCRGKPVEESSGTRRDPSTVMPLAVRAACSLRTTRQWDRLSWRGILRLRLCFAARSKRSAQNDIRSRCSLATFVRNIWAAQPTINRVDTIPSSW